jgi:hypothetical protein
LNISLIKTYLVFLFGPSMKASIFLSSIQKYIQAYTFLLDEFNYSIDLFETKHLFNRDFVVFVHSWVMVNKKIVRVIINK